jgi:tetratricopeptide (TPR) repeat protein
LVARQAKERGIRARFIGGDGWDSSDLDLKAVDGGFFTNHYSPHDPRPEVQNFVRAYGVKYGKVPDALAALAYDATNLMLTAIKDAGTDDTARVKDALNKIRFNGVSGRMTFDRNHNPVKSAVILAVRDNRIVFNSLVDPQEPKPVPVENPTPLTQPPSYTTAIIVDGGHESTVDNADVKTSKKLNAEGLRLLSATHPDFNEARRTFEKAIQLDSSNIEALNNLGYVFGRIGDYRSAEAVLVRVLNIAPKRRAAQGNLGYVQAKLGKTLDAVNHFCQYVRQFDSLERGKAALVHANAADPDPNVQAAIEATVANCTR